jgi:hypothetical protein
VNNFDDNYDAHDDSRFNASASRPRSPSPRRSPGEGSPRRTRSASPSGRSSPRRDYY